MSELSEEKISIFEEDIFEGEGKVENYSLGMYYPPSLFEEILQAESAEKVQIDQGDKIAKQREELKQLKFDKERLAKDHSHLLEQLLISDEREASLLTEIENLKRKLEARIVSKEDSKSDYKVLRNEEKLLRDQNRILLEGNDTFMLKIIGLENEMKKKQKLLENKSLEFEQLAKNYNENLNGLNEQYKDKELKLMSDCQHYTQIIDDLLDQNNDLRKQIEDSTIKYSKMEGKFEKMIDKYNFNSELVLKAPENNGSTKMSNKKVFLFFGWILIIGFYFLINAFPESTMIIDTGEDSNGWIKFIETFSDQTRLIHLNPPPI